MKFEDMCKVITESKKSEKVQNEKIEVDGEKNKVDVLTNQDPEEVQKEQEVKPVVTLDPVEKEFVDKFIEFTELTNLIKTAKEMQEGFKSILGKNTPEITEYLKSHVEENKARCAELKQELKELQLKIRNAEKNAAADSKRKLSLISLLDKAKANNDKEER